MNSFSKDIIYIKKDPFLLYKIDNFFDHDFYLDIKKLFPKVSHNDLNLTKRRI